MAIRYEDMTPEEQKELDKELKESSWIHKNADWSYQNYCINPKEHKKLYPELYKKDKK